MELKQQDIDRELKKKLVYKLDRNCKKSILELRNSNVKHKETIGLLNQSYNTIKNSETNLKKYNFVDANSLLRAAFEYMIMAIMIEDKDDIYNEFLILSNTDIVLTRKYTVINTLLQKFGKKLKVISPTLFYDTTNKEREKLMTDLYDLLCKYTHANLVVSIFDKIKNDNEKEILRLLMSYNLYLIKLILLDCLQYLNHNSNKHIDEHTISLGILLNIIKIANIIKSNNINFEKFTKLLYYDSINNEFYKYYMNGIEKIQKEISFNMPETTKNIDIINQILNEFRVS